MEFSEQEVKIILIKYIIHGVSPFYDENINTRVKLLKIAAEQNGIKYDDAEFQKLGNEILKVQNAINESSAKFLRDNKDLHDTTMRSIKDGNEKIINVVDNTLGKSVKKFFR